MTELYTVERILNKRKIKRGMILLIQEEFKSFSIRLNGWGTVKMSALGNPIKI